MEIRPTYRYSNYTPEVKLTNNKGTFSRYDSNSNTIYIGDGESATLDITIKEQLADVTIGKIALGGQSGGTGTDAKVTCEQTSLDPTKGVIIIKDNEEDYLEDVYKIEEAYIPYPYAIKENNGTYTTKEELINALQTNFTFIKRHGKHNTGTDTQMFYVYDINNKKMSCSGYDGPNWVEHITNQSIYS